MMFLGCCRQEHDFAEVKGVKLSRVMVALFATREHPVNHKRLLDNDVTAYQHTVAESRRAVMIFLK